jgi:hypothetical protein
MSRHLKTLAAIPAAALVLGAAVGPAEAQPLVHERFAESFSEVVEDFCDEITARIDEQATGTFLLNARGPDGLLYGQATVHRTLSFTNLANGKTFTFVNSFVDKDLEVTENGDGTFTLLVLYAGGTRMYGPEGQFLGAGGEGTRYKIVVDENGEFVEDLGVVTGKEPEDGCPLVLSYIG